MGACGVAALVVLLLALALLTGPASGTVLEGEKPSSGEGAPAPIVSAGRPPRSDASEESGQPGSERQPQDSKLTRAENGQEGGETQASASPPPPSPPPPVKSKDSQKVSPPPGGSGPDGGGETEGGNDQDDTERQSKEATAKMKEVMENCDESSKCSSEKEEFSACLQLSGDASIRSFIIVLNKGQKDIDVTVKEAPHMIIDKGPLHLAKGDVRQMNITSISPGGGSITLADGNDYCIIQIRQSVSDWQQKFQQITEYATRLNPIYGAYLFGFTVVLVGVVCVCCKFARRRDTGGVPYQQLEMGAQADNTTSTAGADNTTSAADGWGEGWDDDWDDEEAPARPSDKKTASGVSANGLSLRSHTNNKDGWDVDWDD